MLKDIEKKIPEYFDTEDIFKRFPTDYNESMNTVLYQESIRYNKLLNIIKNSLKDLVALIHKCGKSLVIFRCGCGYLVGYRCKSLPLAPPCGCGADPGCCCCDDALSC